MNLRHPNLSFLTSWILTAALTLSPLMAQNPPSSDVTPVADEANDLISSIPQEETSEAVTPEVAAASKPVRMPVLYAWPPARAGVSFPNVASRSTWPAYPPPAPSRAVSKAPGESKWIILAAIVATGAVVAAVLLFPHFGGNKPAPAVGPIGTVITAGPPNVATPPR